MASIVDIANRFDPGEAEWDDMVTVWEWAASGKDAALSAAVGRMLAEQDRYSEHIEGNPLSSPDRERYAELSGEAWAREAQSCAAILEFYCGEQPAGRTVMRINAVTDFYRQVMESGK